MYQQFSAIIVASDKKKKNAVSAENGMGQRNFLRACVITAVSEIKKIIAVSAENGAVRQNFRHICVVTVLSEIKKIIAVSAGNGRRKFLYPIHHKNYAGHNVLE